MHPIDAQMMSLRTIPCLQEVRIVTVMSQEFPYRRIIPCSERLPGGCINLKINLHLELRVNTELSAVRV